MSTFMCSHAHFDALADYAVKNEVLALVPQTPHGLLLALEMFGEKGQVLSGVLATRQRAPLIGALLRDANANAMVSRYGPKVLVEECAPHYQYKRGRTVLDDGSAYNAARCLHYQCDGERGYGGSLAQAMLEAIMSEAGDMLSAQYGEKAVEAETYPAVVSWDVREEHIRK